MMVFIFTPDKSESESIPVPYLEETNASLSPFYTSKKTVVEVQGEIAAELGKLGGWVNAYNFGIYGVSPEEKAQKKPKRYGYEIRFTYKGAPGLIRVAGLPIRNETPAKKNQVLVQALCNVREWIRNMVTTQVFTPGSEPLVQYILVDGQDGQKTLAEFLLETGKLPLLAAPKVPVTGDIVEG